MKETPYRSTPADELPCSRCRRYLNHAIASLAGVKLGRHERRLLLNAPRSDAEDPEIPEPHDSSRSAREVQRRAIDKLHRVGLVRGFYKKHRIRHDIPNSGRWMRGDEGWGYYTTSTLYALRFLAIRLTPFGDHFVDVMREPLSTGKPIRWAKQPLEPEAAAESIPKLLGRFYDDLGAQYKEWGGIAVTLNDRECFEHGANYVYVQSAINKYNEANA